MFKGFKAVGAMYSIVACKDNKKVDRCGDVGAGGKVVCDDDKLVLVLVDKIKGSGEGREPPRGLYPDKNRSVLIPF